MNMQLIAIGGAIGAAAFAGIAAAQAVSNAWPQIDLKDLERCRPVIQQVHWLEQAHIRNVIEKECGAGAAETCKSARRWLTETRTKDDLVWFFEGNDRCGDTEYPCFGVRSYNEPRTGEEAARWSKAFLDKAAQSYGVTPGMDLRSTAGEADKCVAGIWAAKYQDDRPPAQPGSGEVLASAQDTPAEPPLPATARTPQPALPAALPVAVAEKEAAAKLAAHASKELAAAPSTHAVAAGECVNASVAADKRIDACTVALTALKPEAAGYEELLTQRMSALLTAGRMAEAIADGDQLAARKSGGEGKLEACRIRVLARQQLDEALVACYSTGKPNDPAMLELRGRIHLLVGRYQDAYTDFNAALSGGQRASALYLRGLASAGLGKTSDAVKDLGKAEEAHAGIAASFEVWGYTLAAAASGKPLVEPAALGETSDRAAKAPAPEPAAPAAQPAGLSPVKAKAADPASSAPLAPTATPSVPIVDAAKAPSGVPSPGDASVAAGPKTAAPATQSVAAPSPQVKAKAAGPASSAPPGPPPPLTPTATPSVPIVDPAKGPSGAPSPREASVASPKTVSAVAGSAVSAPGDTTPPATNCIEPLQQGDAGNPVGDNAFRNTCDYSVRFTYCVTQPAIGTNLEVYSCGKDARYRSDIIAPKGVQAAEIARQVAYFACRSPSMPEVAYTEAKGLEGYCR